MAQSGDDQSGSQDDGNSWWSSWPTWLQSAKEKVVECVVKGHQWSAQWPGSGVAKFLLSVIESSTALEFMKRDLTEFSQTVQTDAAAAVSTTAAMLKEKLKVDSSESVANKARQSITSILGTITEAFTPRRELEDAEVIVIRNSEPVILDWWQAQLYTIRKDPKTYCHEPEGPPEVYESWLEEFALEEYQEELSNMMMNCPEVRTLYAKLVPAAVSHLEFWQRYFYRVHLLSQAEAKRAELMKRAEQALPLDDMQWDEEDENQMTLPKNSGVPAVTSPLIIEEKNQYLEVSSMSEAMKMVNEPAKANTDLKIEPAKANTDLKIEPAKANTDLKIEPAKEHIDSKIKPTKENTDFVIEPSKEGIDSKTEQNKDEDSNLTTSQTPSKHFYEDDCSRTLTDQFCNPVEVISSDNAELNIDLDLYVSKTILNEQSKREQMLDIYYDNSIIATKMKDELNEEKSDNNNKISPPSSESASKDYSTGDEWEKDFDLEVTEEDLKQAEETAKRLTATLEGEDDWENWE